MSLLVFLASSPSLPPTLHARYDSPDPSLVPSSLLTTDSLASAVPDSDPPPASPSTVILGGCCKVVSLGCKTHR